MRYGENVSIGSFLAAFVEADTCDLSTFDFQATNRGAQNHFPAATLDFGFAAVVENGERDGGDSHAIAGAVGEKGLPENVDAKARVGAIEFLVESADEDHAPKPLDGTLRLAVAAKPLEHGHSSVFVQVWWPT